MSARIALVVYPGFQILDMAALTVFELANELSPQPRYEIAVVSADGGMVAGSSRVKIETQAIGRRRYDTLLVAGTTTQAPTEPALIAQLSLIHI